MIVKTACPICAKANEVEMSDEQYAKYQDNGYVQDIGLNLDDFRFRELSSHRIVRGLLERYWKKSMNLK